MSDGGQKPMRDEVEVLTLDPISGVFTIKKDTNMPASYKIDIIVETSGGVEDETTTVRSVFIDVACRAESPGSCGKTSADKFEEFVDIFIYSIAIVLLVLTLCLLWYGVVKMCEKFMKVNRVKPTRRRRETGSIENQTTVS
jgi:hypothetical protein